jgi:hypothetical protein
MTVVIRRQKIIDAKTEELQTDLAGLDATFERQVAALKEAAERQVAAVKQALEKQVEALTQTRDTGEASKHAVYDRFMEGQMRSHDQQDGRMKLASDAAGNYNVKHNVKYAEKEVGLHEEDAKVAIWVRVRGHYFTSMVCFVSP